MQTKKIIVLCLYIRKPRHTSVGKVDSILEGQRNSSAIGSDEKNEQIDGGDKDKNQKSEERKKSVNKNDDDEDVEYVSRIWRMADTRQVWFYYK